MEIKLPFLSRDYSCSLYLVPFLSLPLALPSSPPFLFNNALLTTSPFDQERTREDALDARFLETCYRARGQMRNCLAHSPQTRFFKLHVLPVAKRARLDRNRHRMNTVHCYETSTGM